VRLIEAYDWRGRRIETRSQHSCASPPIWQHSS
jgi:hypothetical protein